MSEKIKTLIDFQAASFDRTAYIEIIGDEVVYDVSDGEYGPCYFSLKELEEKIKEHKEKLK